jgi:hypothetical protein
MAGNLYLNTLAYFKELESKSYGRDDSTEAVAMWWQPNDMSITLNMAGFGNIEITRKDLAGPVPRKLHDSSGELADWTETAEVDSVVRAVGHSWSIATLCEIQWRCIDPPQRSSCRQRVRQIVLRQWCQSEFQGTEAVDPQGFGGSRLR